MRQITCQHCGIVFESQRRTRKFCSNSCSNRSSWVVSKTRACRHCQKEFKVAGRGDANRQHCSKECAKQHNMKTIRGWQADNPDAMRKYNENRLVKNPGAWRNHARTQRERTLELLGGQCVVCGVTNPYWLHVDFIPTSRDLRFRHPRHFAYVREHKDQFRVLCANHHYELTLTGAIQGTSIVQ